MSKSLLATMLCTAMVACASLNPPVEIIEVVPVEEPPPTAEPIWYPEPVVQWGNLNLRANGRYQVGELSYTTWRQLDYYVAEGHASWRDERFDERLALSGVAFENDALTAAHRYLPIPSFLRVTNLVNGEATIVRVTDRGPFRSDELLDISRATAQRLGFGDVGSRPVRIELVTEPSERFVLETNYVYGRDAAVSVVSRLVELNLGHLSTTIIPHQYENRYRVKIGDFASIPDANHVANWLSTNLQIGSSLIKE
ncbi:MAG: septal ring lytic transglycosylase RlpA family protein [Gammaproteobacteria bacterium]|nr:septal ring lytic transglycosylase RlpA family protein [Gammaproteobacteria bacterium]